MARRVGDRIEVHVSTQTPYMDLDEVANVLQIGKDQVRIRRPRAVAGSVASSTKAFSPWWRSPRG